MIEIYKPEYKDLWFREVMLSDEKTMSYNHAWGGTVPFPEESWRPWYEHWVLNDEGKRFYRYVKNENGTFVGEIAYHFDDGIGGYAANVIIHSKYRGVGYGGQALDALCAIARENGVLRLYDDLAIDNPALGLFIGRGFSETYRTNDKIILMKEL